MALCTCKQDMMEVLMSNIMMEITIYTLFVCTVSTVNMLYAALTV